MWGWTNWWTKIPEMRIEKNKNLRRLGFVMKTVIVSFWLDCFNHREFAFFVLEFSSCLWDADGIGYWILFLHSLVIMSKVVKWWQIPKILT